MKKYENEKTFTEMFAKDVNNGEKEYEVNGIEFQVSGKSVNSSKAAVYAVHINGTDKAVTIMQLKKLLNVTYKKEYNRTGESAKKANTAVLIKTDEELQETAKVVADTINADIDRLYNHLTKYGVSVSINFSGNDIAQTWMETARIKRDNAAAAQKEAKEKAAKERAEKVETVTELTAELQKALADGNLVKVAEISAKLAKVAK